MLSAIVDKIGQQIAPSALRLWPSLANPAWNVPAAACAVLGEALVVEIVPRRVIYKLSNADQRAVKGRFLVADFNSHKLDRIADLYTFQDMEDIARHGENFRATRLYGWLKASLDAKRPAHGRGQRFDTDEKIEAYYRTYLDMFRSMQQIGYRYEGDDEICLGLRGRGDIVLARRGTHRVAAAQILDLSRIKARITHVDRGFALAAGRRQAVSPVAAFKQAIREALD